MFENANTGELLMKIVLMFYNNIKYGRSNNKRHPGDQNELRHPSTKTSQGQTHGVVLVMMEMVFDGNKLGRRRRRMVQMLVKL